MLKKCTPEQVIYKLSTQKQGTTFVRWHGEFVNQRTCKAVMRCDVHACEYVTNVQNLLAGKTTKCPECYKDSLKIRLQSRVVPDGGYTDIFMATGAYAEGTTFSRHERSDSRGVRHYWNVYCPVCAEDEYAKAGLCVGTFIAHVNTLKSGGAPCRCSKRYNLTDEQWLFRIQKEIERRADGSSLVRIERNSSWSKCIVHLHCAKHESYQSTLNNFLYGGTACPSCATNGFDPSKPASFYVLRAYSDSVEFTGYGIAGDVDSRLKVHRRNLRQGGFLISEIETFSLQGENAFEIERRVKAKFPLFGQATEGFRKEATYSWLFDDLVAFAEDQCLILEPNGIS